MAFKSAIPKQNSQREHIQKMKIIALLLLFLVETVTANPTKGQPEYLGITLEETKWRYATLFEGGGGKFYFTSARYPTEQGMVLTFGNGEKGVVKNTHKIRGGFLALEYDLAIGELINPISAKPVKTWWNKPPDFDSLDGKITVTGFGPDGWFTGTQGVLLNASPECFDGLRDFNPIMGERFLGSPIFYQDYFLGINCGYFCSEGEEGGLTTMAYKVLEEFPHLFPKFLQPPIEPTVSTRLLNGRIEVILKSPIIDKYRISNNEEINFEDGWKTTENEAHFMGYDPCPGPWETILIWNPEVNTRMFFRAEIIP